MGSVDSHSRAGLEETTMLIATDARLWTPGGGRYFRFSGLVSALRRHVACLDFITSRTLSAEDVARLRTIGFDNITTGRAEEKPRPEAALRSRIRSICPPPLAAAFRSVRSLARRVGSMFTTNRTEVRNISDLQSPQLPLLVADYLKKKSPDFVMVEYLMYAYALEPLRDLSVHDRPITMIDTHDVTHKRCAVLETHGIPTSFDLTWDEEQAILGDFDIIVAIQDEDRKTFETMCPARTAVTCLPSCVIDPVGPSPDRRPKSAAFFGGRGYCGPNVLGLALFLDQAWPLIRKAHPTAALSVFGDTRDAFEGRSFPGVSFEGFVPDLREAYARTDLVISPVTFGGGLKTKVLEGLAYGRPVVATAHSAIGFPDSRGGGLFVADDWRAFAEIVNELFSHPARIREESRFAVDYVEQHFSEPRVTRDLITAMQIHLGRRRARMKSPVPRLPSTAPDSPSS